MIDADPTSAVTALRSNLLNEVKNAAQAAKQAGDRAASDRTTKNVKDSKDAADAAQDLNTGAGSSDPYRGKSVDTTA
jgi:hypothetical protein